MWKCSVYQCGPLHALFIHLATIYHINIYFYTQKWWLKFFSKCLFKNNLLSAWSFFSCQFFGSIFFSPWLYNSVTCGTLTWKLNFVASQKHTDKPVHWDRLTTDQETIPHKTRLVNNEFTGFSNRSTGKRLLLWLHHQKPSL